MSSIQSLRNQYDQLRLQSISSQYNKTNSSTKTVENSKPYFQSDAIEISEEGLAALEAELEGEMPPMDKPHGKPPMGPPPAQDADAISSVLNGLLDKLYGSDEADEASSSTYNL